MKELFEEYDKVKSCKIGSKTFNSLYAKQFVYRLVALLGVEVNAKTLGEIIREIELDLNSSL